MQATASWHTQLHASNYRGYFLLFIPFHNDQFSLPCVDRHIYAFTNKVQKFIALTEVMPSDQALNLHTLLFQTCPLDNKQQWQSFRWTYDHEEKTLPLQHQLCQCTRQTPAHHKCCLAVMLLVKHHHNIQHPGSFERLYKVQNYRRWMNQENPQNQHNFGHFHLLICRNNSINTML